MTKPFWLSGPRIYDGNGEEFIARGFNHTCAWGKNNVEALGEFPATEANAVRVCFSPVVGESKPAQRQAVVEKLLGGGIVPIVVDGFGGGPLETTGKSDPAPMRAAVDRWVQNAGWLKQCPQVILNIANEWGPDSVVWRDEYVAAVLKLRAAGIENLILVDTGNKGAPGQCPLTIERFGWDVLTADPLHRVAFSVHMYNQWRDEVGAADLKKYANCWDIRTELTKIRALGLAVIVGEFTGLGHPLSRFAPENLMKICAKLRVGWLAWVWNQDKYKPAWMVKGWQYRSDADLTDFGTVIVDGLKA